MGDIKTERNAPLRVGMGLFPGTADINEHHDPTMAYVENPKVQTQRELFTKRKADDVSFIFNISLKIYRSI